MFVDEIVSYSTEQDLVDILHYLKIILRTVGINTVNKILHSGFINRRKELNCISIREILGFRVVG